MSYSPPAATDFDGGKNLGPGHKEDGKETLPDYLRKFKSGSVTFSGAGTEAVTFGEEFEDANYTVAFAPDTVSMDPIYAAKAVGGFDITSAAAGDVDWIAIHD